MRSIVVGFLCGVAMVATGCANTEYNAVVSNQNELAASLCACWSELGAESEDQCLEQFQSPTTDEEDQCIEDVYQQNQDDVQPYADCVLGVLNDVKDCVDAVEACDTEAIAACAAQTGDIQDCPEVPESVNSAIQECLGGTGDTAAG